MNRSYSVIRCDETVYLHKSPHLQKNVAPSLLLLSTLLGPKTSLYTRIELDSATELKAVLTASNGLLGVVVKQRELFFLGRTRIHLDEVEMLGTFLELEVVLNESETSATGMVIADDLMAHFEIQPEQLISNPYFDLLGGNMQR